MTTASHRCSTLLIVTARFLLEKGASANQGRDFDLLYHAVYSNNSAMVQFYDCSTVPTPI
jgi:hypothetical protein